MREKIFFQNKSNTEKRYSLSIQKTINDRNRDISKHNENQISMNKTLSNFKKYNYTISNNKTNCTKNYSFLTDKKFISKVKSNLEPINYNIIKSNIKETSFKRYPNFIKIFHANNFSKKKYIKLKNFSEHPDENEKNIQNKKEYISPVYNMKKIILIKNKNNILPKIKNEKNSNEFYFYIIKQENCGYLVKRCFNHRKNWLELFSSSDINFNFKWQQNTRDIYYSNLSRNFPQMVNHFEFHNLISNKANLFVNIMRYLETINENIFKYLPLTILYNTNKDYYNDKMDKLSFLINNLSEFIIDLKNENKKMKKKLNKKKLYKTFFPFNDNLGNKTIINIPNTHVNLSQNNPIINYFWLIKLPNLNRGRCIKILTNINDIKKYIKEYSNGIKTGYFDDEEVQNYNNDTDDRNYIHNTYKKNYFPLLSSKKKRKIKIISLFDNKKDNKNDDNDNKYKSDIIIIQKYIEKPLLYYGRKFDIRIWVLLTHDLKIYMFNEGHLKCSSINYSLNSNNPFIHLTNYSFQKYNKNFEKFEYGNEVSFGDLQINIDKNYFYNKINFRNIVIPKIKKIIKICFESIKNKININNKKYMFEIFGFDFMIDEEYEPFLIEVNMNPGLEESSPLIKMLIPRMLDDALRLTLDKIFDTIYCFNGKEIHSSQISNLEYKSPFHVNGYDDSDNLFVFISKLDNSSY